MKLVLEVAEQVDDLRLDRDVERRHGLVEQDQLRVDRERASDPDPLALTAGELVREPVQMLAVQADAIEQLVALGLDLVLRDTPRIRSGVARICATRLRGFSDACGSWKTICISRRIGCIWLRPAFVMSWPRKRIAPPVASISRTSARISVVLPQPDSPTIPSVSPLCSANETSSTACTWPDRAVDDQRPT